MNHWHKKNNLALLCASFIPMNLQAESIPVYITGGVQKNTNEGNSVE